MTAILTVIGQFTLTALVAFWAYWTAVEVENMRDTLCQHSRRNLSHHKEPQ